MAAPSTASPSRVDERAATLVLAAVVLVGAVLRFGTIGLQHFWVDEATTAAIVQLPPGDLLDAVRLLESSPPLYYALGWVWAQLFGTGEVAMRALPALAGVAAIPVTYAATIALSSRLAGLVAAALVAVAPVMVWYSQEHRVYSLLILLIAVTVLFWARVLRGDGARAAAGWACAAALAFFTHYFAAFVVIPQALWLLATVRPRRPVVVAVGVVGAAGLAVTPLALAQRAHNAEWVSSTPLLLRVGDTARTFLGGTVVIPVWAIALVGLLVLGALALGRHAGPRDRRAMAALGTLVAGGLVVPAALAVVGLDYVLDRNLVGAWIPAAMLVSIAATASDRRPRRLGALVAALTVLALALTVAVPLDRDLQREAFTAGLSDVPLDEHRQRLLPVVEFARVPPGAVTARCPDGYAAATGTGLWLTSSGQRPADAAGDGGDGWRAVARSDRRRGEDLVLAAAVCARPR